MEENLNAGAQSHIPFQFAKFQLKKKTESAMILITLVFFKGISNKIN